MKKIVNLIFVFAFFFGSSSVFAQGALKIGFIDSQKLILQMPEAEAAKKTMENETKQLQNQLEVMQVEFNNKLKALEDNEKLKTGDPNKWTEIIMQDKGNELRGLQQRIQEFSNNAQQTLKKRQSELYEPILKKVDEAIKKVAADGGYALIIDPNAVLFVSPTLCTDITPDVKKILGLK